MRTPSLKSQLQLALLFLSALNVAGIAQAQLDSSQKANRPAVTGGRILIAAGKLLMIDRATKQILWESTELRYASSAAALTNGEFLVAERTGVARVNSEGKLLGRAPSRFKLTTGLNVLKNGHILVCDGSGGTVQEIDWEGNVYWSVSKLHHPSEAVRLDNGNTLVADGTAGLKEFDSTGVLVKTIWLKRWVASVQRLPDGTTLVGESRAYELLDEAGRPVWTLDTTSRVTGASKISDNEYLIVQPDAGSVSIVDSAGRIIWEMTGLRYPWTALYIP